MITLYYHPSPNPAKVALFLEEAGLEYTVAPVDTRLGEQFAPSFLAINPNGKTPALTDGAVVLFDSTAILLHLATKMGMFLGDPGEPGQARMRSWLMLIATGIGPYSGQAVHFKHFAPEPKDYAVNRYLYEAERHWGLVDTQLASHPYVGGDSYSIVDMSVWGWARAIPFVLAADAWGVVSERQTARGRDHGATCGQESRGSGHRSPVQTGDGRGGAYPHVPAEHATGRRMTALVVPAWRPSLARIMALAFALVLGSLAPDRPASAQDAPSDIDVGPKVGARVPAFNARDAKGEPRTLRSIMGRSGVVLVFFRSAKWCPFCQAQLMALRDLPAQLAPHGYTLAGISYDPPEVLSGFTSTREINYILLSDAGSKTIDAFKLRDPKYKPDSIAYGVPQPSIFVISRNGVIRAKLAKEGYKIRPDNRAIVAAVVKAALR